MSVETAKLLRAARARIPTSETWTQGCLGRTKNGEPIIFASDLEKASCFCGYGAVEIEAFNNPSLYLALCALDEASGSFDFPSWQDSPSTTHADVLAVFDRAIAAEESAP